jgi:hypothetical protein
MGGAPLAAGADADPVGLAALVARTEELRGLRFVRRPTLELVAAGDERLPALLAANAERRPLPVAGQVPAEAGAGSCFPLFESARVLCLAPAGESELREALARLLDAQVYPRLVALAPGLPGDPGVALRALLAASALAAADAGFPPAPAEPPRGALALETLEIPPGESADHILLFAAALFLAVQPDREKPFRTPPLSTKQLLSPPAYLASERPALLEGAAPALAGCRPAQDESVGAGRLLATLAGGGGSVPGRLLAGWKGDRAVRFACDGAGDPWLYVAEFAEEAQAEAFAKEGGALLPGELSRPLALERIGRRVVFFHGLAPPVARSWAAALEARALRCLEPLACGE